MALIAQGAKRLAIGDRVYDYGPGQYLVASVDLPITGHYTHSPIDEPALGFGPILRPQRIAALLLETEDRVPPARSHAAPPGLGVAEATPELLDAIVRMVRLLDRPGDRAVLAPMIEREVLWLILNGPLGATVRQIGLQDSSLSRVSRAVRWISEHYNQPVPRGATGSLVRDEHVRLSPGLPGGHGTRPDSVSEADPPSEVPSAAARRG